jgi:arylsulfatase
MKNLAFLILVVVVISSPIQSQGQDKDPFNRTILPIPEKPFAGKIGLTPSESEKDFPPMVVPPEGAPNVLIIMTDDVGFAASEVFGGPVPTPAFNRLADNGLVYNQFHTTAQCSPTRAALLTGRNHHTAGTGSIMEMGVGYPGYNTVVSKSLTGIGTILKENGYNTAWFGKNHNVPDWQNSQAGPYDLWPTGLGFEYFYGFLGGDAHQFSPALFEGTKPIEPPYKVGYHLDKDLAEQAIKRIRTLNAMAPDKPFFVYYTPGTSHAPHHAPQEWIDKFKGKFDMGWDELRKQIHNRQIELGVIPKGTKLTPRPDAIKAWDEWDKEHQEVFARMMEVYAAALAHCDYQISRVIDAIEETGRLDNTLIIYIQGDNGASGEGGDLGMLNEITLFNDETEDWKDIRAAYEAGTLGGPMHFNHKPAAWAHAMSTPFQWTKLVASHFGGTRNGMVISWPEKFKGNRELRSQFHHVIDILPTVLEASNIPAPIEVNGVAQKPIEGTSMVYTFDQPEEPSHRTTQYFEIFARRGIYHDGWVAATTPKTAPWIPNEPSKNAMYEYDWELYNVAEDFSQANDLAEKYPQKLRELKDLFLVEATKYNVLPLDDSNIERFDVTNRPSYARGKTSFTYYEGMVRIPEGSAPDLKNKSYTITAEVNLTKENTNGVIVTQGGRPAGYGLFMKEGKLIFHYNYLGIERFEVVSEDKLPLGESTITCSLDYKGEGLGGPGTLTLAVNGKKVGEGRIEKTIPIRISLDETFDVGEDTGTPVSEAYEIPFHFEGELIKLMVDLK